MVDVGCCLPRILAGRPLNARYSPTDSISSEGSSVPENLPHGVGAPAGADGVLRKIVRLNWRLELQ
jgi:hypothetical protein